MLGYLIKRLRAHKGTVLGLSVALASTPQTGVDINVFFSDELTAKAARDMLLEMCKDYGALVDASIGEATVTHSGEIGKINNIFTPPETQRGTEPTSSEPTPPTEVSGFSYREPAKEGIERLASQFEKFRGRSN